MSSHSNNTLASVKEGDTVIRFVAGTMPTELEVTHVTNDRIVCADWEFDRISGAEIDELLGWGPPPQRISDVRSVSVGRGDERHSPVRRTGQICEVVIAAIGRIHATSVAILASVSFSSAELTGPRSVTLPLAAMILAFRALIDRSFTSRTRCRIFAVMSTSAWFSF